MRGKRPTPSRPTPRGRGAPTKRGGSRSFATRPRGARSGNNIRKNRTRSGPVNVAEARKRAGARTVRGGRPVGASPGGPKGSPRRGRGKKPISVAELRKKAGARTFRGRPVGASPRGRGRPTSRGRGPSRPKLIDRFKGRGKPTSRPLNPAQRAEALRKIAEAKKLRSQKPQFLKGTGGTIGKAAPSPKRTRRVPRRRATPFKKAAPKSRVARRGIPRRRVTPTRRKS